MKYIESFQNPLVKKAFRVRTSKTYRKEIGLAILSGSDTLLEHLKTSTPYALIGLKEKLALFSSLPSSTLYATTLPILLKILGLPSCEGILGLFPIPKPSLKPSRRAVFLDGLQDPGNVGTLIRSMKAFSWSQLILYNTVDIFNDKCLRSAKGMSFDIPYTYMDYTQLISFSSEHQLPLIKADMHGKTITSTNQFTEGVLILGNEGRGSDFPHPHEKIAIPMNQSCESLNVGVAGSILMYLIQDFKKTTEQ